MPDMRKTRQILLDDFNSGDHLHAILELSTDAIYMKDLDSRYLLINPSGAARFGLKPHEVIGKTDVDLLGEAQGQARRHSDLRVMQQRQPHSYEQTVSTVMGTITVHTTKVPYMGQDGQLLGVIGISRDITERKNMEKSLQESEARLRQVFEVAPDGIVVLEPETSIIVDCNSATCTMNGYTREELIGQTIDLINYSDLNPEQMAFIDSTGFSIYKAALTHADYLALLRKEGFLKYINYHRSKDGRIFPVEVSTTLIPLNGREYIVGYDRDISERVRAIEARLESERLQTALQKEIELHDLKSKMMERVSHEFRTPLSLINVATEFLGRYANKLSEEQRGERLNMIRRQVSHLDKLLEGIAYVVQGQHKNAYHLPDTFDVDAICQSIIEHCQTTIGIAHRFEYETSLAHFRISTDENLIYLILTNLLSNAIKFSPPNSVIGLQVDLDAQGLVLRVRDEGVGIPVHERDAIFEPFYRGSNFDERPGLGIGLTIVKNAVRSLNGTIDIESCPHAGTCFTVHIPMQAG